MSEYTVLENRKVQKRSLPVSGMTCAACANSVETILKKSEGVLNANVNFADHTRYGHYRYGIRRLVCEYSVFLEFQFTR